jgi:D-3-phosphoglycerate dehydrogenase
LKSLLKSTAPTREGRAIPNVSAVCTIVVRTSHRRSQIILSGRVHILVADDIPASAIDLLRAEGWNIDARSGRSPDQLARDLHDADALVVRSATRVTAALIEAAPRLRAIARAGTGVDNVDVAAASARGIVVMNAPGANSVSVAELTMALLLTLARPIPAADAAMKQGRWEKKKFLGEEVRDKALGLVGFGRIGQEVARRAASFGMTLLAHDPFVSEQVAADLDVELVTLDALFERADYLSLHLPATAQTRHIVNAERLARARRGIRIINTARGDLVDEAALADAIEAGQVGGAAIDVYQTEPTVDQRLQMLPQVVATPHIAASTREGQELVGTETAAALRDFLRDGVIRNAVNFPSVSPEEFKRLQPFVVLAERLGAFIAQMNEDRVREVSVRYYGELTRSRNGVIVNAVLAGLLKPILSSGVTLVNARAVAAERGIEVTESLSTRPRNYTSLISLKLLTSQGERWVEGAVFERVFPRLVQLDGIGIEAPLNGTMIVMQNADRPGVIGSIGTILGRHGVNIANFALGRAGDRAIGIATVDEHDPIPDSALERTAASELHAARSAIDHGPNGLLLEGVALVHGGRREREPSRQI